MSIETLQRNFSDYQHGDDVRELGSGTLYEVADALRVDISGYEPDPITLGAVVGALGPKPVLRDNRELTDIWTPEEAAELANRSGIMLALDRGLWTPDDQTPANAKKILSGAVANWQDRAAAVLVDREEGGEVIIATGDRVMNSKTEITNWRVDSYYQTNGSYPTESQYAAKYVVPRLGEAGYDTHHLQYEGMNGDQIAAALVATRPEVFLGDVAAVRVANAGIQLACQLRKAAIDTNPDVYGPDAPRMYVITDTLPVASNQDEIGNPTEFQSPYTALRQVALTGKLLVEAARS